MKRVLALLCLAPTAAWAGGFELPDNGTEALGRGGAFTAKADDATALEYNVAGLATQRGTRVLLDANIAFHDYEFTRAGNYPGDPTDPKTPYAGTRFPTVSNNGGPFFAPFFGLSTDLGLLDRWTFAVGAYGPSSVGNRTFGLTVNGPSGSLPAPSRYDLVSANLVIAFPTLAAAFRATHWLDVGVALQLVVSSFELQNASVVPLGSVYCPQAEYQPCDVPTKVNTSGLTATAAFGLMFHPRHDLDLGVNVRAPVDVDTSGTVSNPDLMLGAGSTPEHQSAQTGAAEFHSHLPWVVRLGVRYKFMKEKFEAGDIELDGTWEGWGEAEGKGDSLHVDDLGPLVHDITVNIAHNYRDTGSVRVGGAYNLQLPHGVLTFRLGGYFDSSATHYKDTRLDFDTMAKYAGTFGLGYRIRGVAINLAYAYVWSPDRDVTNGALEAINGIDGSNKVSGQPLPVVNNGHYTASTQLLSLGFTIAWDELLKKQRVLAYE